MVPEVDVKELRARLGMSQPEFAKRFGFNLETLRQWEQGRYSPDSATRAYLAVISHSPDTAAEGVAAAARR